jgi:hypothetical protein
VSKFHQFVRIKLAYKTSVIYLAPVNETLPRPVTSHRSISSCTLQRQQRVTRNLDACASLNSFSQLEQRRKSQIKRSRNTSVGVDGWRPRLGRTFCSPASELWPDLINKTPPTSTTPMRDFLSLLICNGKASKAFRSKGRAPHALWLQNENSPRAYQAWTSGALL